MRRALSVELSSTVPLGGEDVRSSEEMKVPSIKDAVVYLLPSIIS